jgi:hypothetical protein
MPEPKPPIPAGLGRQPDGVEDFVLPYGQNICPNVQPGPLGAWAPPLALGWETHPYVSPTANWREREYAQANHELTLLREVYGNVQDVDGNKYDRFGKNGWVLAVERYMYDRDNFIGYGPAADAYLASVIAELDADNAKLRRSILPSISDRKKHPNSWQAAQNIFYMWVRRGYDKALAKRNVTVSIPALIGMGTNQKLRDALKQVVSDYGQNFPQQADLVARPIKLNDNFKLGTLSDHAFGLAVDINPEQNAQINQGQWGHILTLTGKSLDETTRKSKWKSDPEELHRLVREISDAFASKLAELVDAQAQAKAKDPLAAAIEADASLKQLRKAGFNFAKWRNGFFNLEWRLVKELHEEDLVWGAVFKSPDLHHFELPPGTPLLPP